MRLRPLHDWALIRRIASAEKTSGGIIIPEAAKEKPAEGVVEAVGPGRYKKEPGKKGRYIPTVLKPGQRVYFTEYMAKDVEVDGGEYTFIREEDVLGIAEEAGAVSVRKEHPVTKKVDQPVMVQQETRAEPKAVPAEKKPAPKKKAPAKKSAPKAKKAVVTKKTATAKKAKPVKKTAKKAAPKATGKKKIKSPSKKTSTKKTLAKKTAKPAKKAAAKKVATKKPVRKTDAKTKKRNKK